MFLTGAAAALTPREMCKTPSGPEDAAQLCRVTLVCSRGELGGAGAPWARPAGYLRKRGKAQPPGRAHRMSAALVDDAMENYAYPSYNPYSYRYQQPKGKGGPGPWRQRGGYFSGYGDTAAVAAAAAEYFDNYQRAQLKAILSQVNPNLTPRLRKANTKEVGVQVNPRQDASVQCSLGPRPLLLRRRVAAGAEQEQGSPVSGSNRTVRFPRTIAVYSPVASRRLTTFLEEAESTLRAPLPQEGHEDAPGRSSWEKPDGSSAESQEQQRQKEQREEVPAAVTDAGEALLPEKPQEAVEEKRELEEDGAPTAPKEEKREETEEGSQVAGKSAGQQQQPGKECEQSKTRVRFQVYFRQFCRTCQKSYNPYR
uniref:Zygote arrest 1 n=1 Tax=Salvator merianae TaxID=96440 RepID=A0A8D0B5I5_SALMN